MNNPHQTYLEKHSALNGALLAYGLLPVAAGIICLTVGIAADQSWLSGPVGAFIALMLISVAITELRQMRNAPQYHTLTNRWSPKRGVRRCNIGVLASPFMRAALVIEVNPAAVTVTEIRPARFYSNYKDGQFSHLVRPQPSPTWVVPTRHPERLSAPLQIVPGQSLV